VCEGLATRWTIPVGQVRALFVVAAALAGFGVLAYAACWLVLPTDDETDESPSLVRGMASLALLAAATAGLATLAAAAGGVTLFGFGWAVAVAAAVFLVGALVSWPMVRPAWVLLPLAAAVVPGVVVAASGVRIAAQAGVVVAAPRALEDMPAAGYRTGLGDLLVDLRDLRAPADATIPLRLDTGTGRTVVALPRNRCFNLDVRYRATSAWPLNRILDGSRLGSGSIGTFFYGQSQPANAGHWTRAAADPHAPTLRIDYTAVNGSLWIRDYPAATGPLYEPYWPSMVRAPASPGALRWAWRNEVHRPAVQRRWRRWRKEAARFDHRMKALVKGSCAPGEVHG
jgi:phage shock protein PspC (stress-responsive transcriptional regulator)